MVRKVQKKKLLAVLLLLVEFNLLAIPMYAIMYYKLSFLPLQKFLAGAAANLLKLLGYTAIQDRERIVVPTGDRIQSIEVSWDSTGWKSMYALVALGLVTPVKGWDKRLKFILISVPSIFLINFFRLLTTILFAMKFGFEYFEVIHTFLWREGLIFAVVLIWGVWLWKEKDNININQIYH